MLGDLVVVPQPIWGQICGDCRVVATRQRARHAAGWLWTELTGGYWEDAPAPQAATWPSRPLEWESLHRHFTRTIPAPLAARLMEWGTGLLSLPRRWLTASTPRRGVSAAGVVSRSGARSNSHIQQAAPRQVQQHRPGDLGELHGAQQLADADRAAGEVEELIGQFGAQVCRTPVAGQPGHVRPPLGRRLTDLS
jgi:hypothetical protein